MSYHAEHHLYPLTTFHLLSKLLLKVCDKLWRVGESHPIKIENSNVFIKPA